MGNSLRARILRRGLMEEVGLELLTAKIRSVEKNATFQPGKKEEKLRIRQTLDGAELVSGMVGGEISTGRDTRWRARIPCQEGWVL